MHQLSFLALTLSSTGKGKDFLCFYIELRKQCARNAWKNSKNSLNTASDSLDYLSLDNRVIYTYPVAHVRSFQRRLLTVKPDVLLMGTLQTSAATLVFD